MSRSRYPGAQPFSEQQADIFFGRQTAIQELYQLIRQEPLVVLYSKSGLGKSSLINAGVIPKARKEKQFRPIPIRFYAYTGEEKMPVVTTGDQVRGDQPTVTTFLDQLIENEKTLWHDLKEQQITQGDNRELLLIFDQFEELFTYPREAQLAFRKQLAEALYTPVPQRYWDMLDLYGADDMPLSDEELALLQRPIDLRIVVSIRQDRMHLLGSLSDYLPTISKNWYELKALDEDNAKAAIISPASAKGDYKSAPFVYSDEALKDILNFLTEDGQSYVESTQLQIVCNSIENKVIKQQLDRVEPENIGALEEIIENYYTEKINTIEDDEQRLAARKLIEEGLIFEEEERRLSVYEGQIFKSFQIEKATLRALVDSHLLRAEPSLRGGYTYELSHDTLVAPILKAKTERLEEERQLREAELRKQREAELAEERRKRRRTTLFAIGASILAVIAIVAAVFAFQQTAYANEQAQLAKDNEEIALKRKQEAQDALDRFLEEDRKRRALEVRKLMEDVEYFNKAGFDDALQITLDSILKIDTTAAMRMRIDSLREALE
jgi:hypothetical protein